MKQYLDLLKYVLENGEERVDRTGVGTIGVFGYQTRYNLQDGFPLVTTKKVHFKSIAHELLWFISGSTNNNDLENHNVTIWREWANPDGSLGFIYGKQWRAWEAKDGRVIDQLAELVENIKWSPYSRRHILTAWNVGDLKYMNLPPCHAFSQFYVQKGQLSCMLTQRSADCMLGAPYNIASYALLTHMIAQVCNLQVGEFIHSIGDAHIYLNHLDQVKLQLTRDPRTLPQLRLNPDRKSLFDFTYEDITLEGYNPHPAIKAEVAI